MRTTYVRSLHCCLNSRMKFIRSAEHHQTDSPKTTCTSGRAMVFVLDPTKTYDRSTEWPYSTRSQLLEVQDSEMASDPITRHRTGRHSTLHGPLNVPKPAVTTVVPHDAVNGEELDFTETDVVALVRKNNYKLHMCVEIRSNILVPTVSIFDPGTGPNMFGMSFLPVNWQKCICPVNNISSKSASGSPVNVVGKSYGPCPAGRSTHVFLSCCRVQSRCTATNQNIIRWQCFKENNPQETTYPPHPISPSRNYFWTEAHVRPAGCATELLRRWDLNRRTTRLQQKNISDQSPEVRCDSAKCRNICISYDQQRQTHLNDVSEFNAWPNGPTASRIVNGLSQMPFPICIAIVSKDPITFPK